MRIIIELDYDSENVSLLESIEELLVMYVEALGLVLPNNLIVHSRIENE
ncbi:MAG: hypothetical protein ACREOB_07775 [Thermodesulfobacteriota bacterium]